jgi:hypothetical protein
MKKISLMMIFVFLTSLANAQDDFRKFKFGLKASPNLSWFKPDQSEFLNDGVRFRFSYGLVTEFAFGNNYSFLTGVEMLSTGGGLNFEGNGFYEAGGEYFKLNKRNYTLNYVNIPLSLKMTTNEVGFMRYFATFGVDLGTRTRARAKDEVNPYIASTGVFSTNTVNRDEIDILKDVPLFRLGLNIGIGTTYNISGNTDLLVSVNWSNGFVNSLKKESVNIKNYDDEDYTGRTPEEKLNDFENSDRTRFKQKATSNFVTLNVGVMF